jgi:hypothetical protein
MIQMLIMGRFFVTLSVAVSLGENYAKMFTNALIVVFFLSTIVLYRMFP